MTAASCSGFQRNGIPFSAMYRKDGGYDMDPAVFSEQTDRAQAVYFFDLVIMQWFNLLSTRTRLFQQNPGGSSETRNVLLFPAMLAALLLACFFYLPWFQKVFLTKGIAAVYFLPMACLDKTRKYMNRKRKYPKSWLAKIAW
uniref:Cation-transporting P-type ATPase C-terminal domain-containing protein n=1 Tax=Mycena chlorophos TaxID=658473 RepID=A0ABQ0LG52_MYCCL|nr:predicted protein [Mycena chlorophos]